MTATYFGMIGLITINPSSGCSNNKYRGKTTNSYVHWSWNV